ncbi:hypothetical protein C1645_729639 [Glomus cerebriforme]|uniref:DUF7707 domain-containing protein n=1 Tax=Glomus cerebriforme TaxID=658196 RepID=A0A397S9L9_9GLOM|nr:hypothetical protein C1645_729639 [Glomus cerebriforme]
MLQLKGIFFVIFLFSIILFITEVHPLNPADVDPATKATWCSDQMATCTNICWDSGFDPTTNFCLNDTLQFDCVCSNGIRPNSTEYTQTIPYFTCTADQQACIQKCQPATDTCVNACKSTSCAATVIKSPSKIPTTVQGTTSSPAAPGIPGSTTTPAKNPNAAILGAATMISPIKDYFTLFFSLVIILIIQLLS